MADGPGGPCSMRAREQSSAVAIRVLGVVQGVGFRPFVYRLATELNIVGHVRNTSEDVSILAQGPPPHVDEFVRRLRTDAPPLAHIREIAVAAVPVQELSGFEILASTFDPTKGQMVSPDVATCEECLAELLDEDDRRYRYPFTNCTNCGPRFTIIRDMPYDRPNTTMDVFDMCDDCRVEYEDPLNRRFHAQPNGCPVCGPHVTLLDAGGRVVDKADPIAATARLLERGHIVAIKGLGGYLLACDATSGAAVQRLRDRKCRPSKPLAVMVRDVQRAEAHCEIDEAERSLLTSAAAPIVLLRWRDGSSICREVAPSLRFLGVMLPYTPLHHTLLRECPRPLVMTSGNLSEEPIVADNQEALERLAGIADYFLAHNRGIHSRYDDSVVMVVDGAPQFLRRARGYAPRPIELPFDAGHVLAVGPQLKNTFCMTKGRSAFVSQHIGDLDSLETLEHFEETIELYRHLFRIEPELVAHDLHPDYPSTSFALQYAGNAMPAVAVQHHHAHIAGCMVENGTTSPVIGVAFDGAGLGTDGAIWGGEFLVCTLENMRRVGQLEYMPLPGGDSATLNPYRTAISYVTSLLGSGALARCRGLLADLQERETEIIVRQVERRLNTPDTSSMGRLFDVVSAMLGVRKTVSYEGQAAIELEMAAHSHGAVFPEGGYRFDIDDSGGFQTVRLASVVAAVLEDTESGQSRPLVAARFHEAVARMTVDVCNRIRQDTGLAVVALSGGVFQNRLLLHRTSMLLKQESFEVLTHTSLPANDGCISLGQAVVAASARKTRE